MNLLGSKQISRAGNRKGAITERAAIPADMEELGTGPAIANKIKGLRGFGGGTGAVVQICHCQYYTENSILLV